MRALCIDNYYGEYLDEPNISLVLKGINMPIFYKDISYNLEYLEDYIKVSTDGIDKNGDFVGRVTITFDKEQFLKYFIDVAKTRQEQIDSIIHD